MKIKRPYQKKLEDWEIIQKGQEIAHLHADKSEIEKELKEFSKERNKEIKEREDSIARICRVIEAGTQEVEVECDVHKNLDRQTLEYWHEGKLIDERALTEDDKQESFFDVGDDKFDAAPKEEPIDEAEAVFDEQFASNE